MGFLRCFKRFRLKEESDEDSSVMLTQYLQVDQWAKTCGSTGSTQKMCRPGDLK